MTIGEAVLNIFSLEDLASEACAEKIAACLLSAPSGLRPESFGPVQDVTHRISRDSVRLVVDGWLGGMGRRGSGGALVLFKAPVAHFAVQWGVPTMDGFGGVSGGVDLDAIRCDPSLASSMREVFFGLSRAAKPV